MRLLHTSDWHLGRTLHGESLLEPQHVFLRWLVGLATARQVDAVLVAGDVYDRAVPTTDAVALLDDVLVALARAGIPVLLTSGNHDSAIRLGFGSELHAVAGVHVRTRLDQLITPLLLHDEGGPVGIYGIPYLLPDAVLADLDAERSHSSVLDAAVRRIRADATARGLDRVVAVGHAFVTGGAPSESERDISIGGIGDVPVSIFDGLSYVALGHLHGPQRVTDRIRYSGSPLPFSFSERAHAKSVTVVELDDAGAVDVELVPTPVPRPMRQVRGRLEELVARAGTDLAPLAQAWVKVVLTDPGWCPAAMDRLRQVWPHTLVLDRDPDGGLTSAAADAAHIAAVTDPVEICAAFVEWVDSTRPDRDQREALERAVAAVRAAELSA
jgi:exonuclease SbcD